MPVAPSKSKMSVEEKKWQAENDCRTLAEAQAIMKDKSRHRAAVAEAKRKMSELSKVAKG